MIRLLPKVAAATLVAAAGIAACGTGSAEQFCEVSDGSPLVIQPDEVGADDLRVILDDLVAAAPDELDDDVLVLSNAVEGTRTTEPGGPDSVELLDSPEVAKAVEHIDEFAAGNC